MENWIKNFDELVTTENRKNALKIMEAGLDAINTEEVIKNKGPIVAALIKQASEGSIPALRNNGDMTHC